MNQGSKSNKIFIMLQGNENKSLFFIDNLPLNTRARIVDIAQIVKPKLNFVDTEEKVILGRDALAVDIVACRFVNLDPLEVEHLKLVSKDRREDLEDYIKKN